MMSRLPLRICYDPSYELKIQTRHSFLLRDDILTGKSNCNMWEIFRAVFKSIIDSNLEFQNTANGVTKICTFENLL